MPLSKKGTSYDRKLQFHSTWFHTVIKFVIHDLVVIQKELYKKTKTKNKG